MAQQVDDKVRAIYQALEAEGYYVTENDIDSWGTSSEKFVPLSKIRTLLFGEENEK